MSDDVACLLPVASALLLHLCRMLHVHTSFRASISADTGDLETRIDAGFTLLRELSLLIALNDFRLVLTGLQHVD